MHLLTYLRATTRWAAIWDQFPI